MLDLVWLLIRCCTLVPNTLPASSIFSVTHLRWEGEDFLAVSLEYIFFPFVSGFADLSNIKLHEVQGLKFREKSFENDQWTVFKI